LTWFVNGKPVDGEGRLAKAEIFVDPGK